MNIIDISEKITGRYSFRKRLHWRYFPWKSEEKKSGSFSDSEIRKPSELDEKINLAFKKYTDYEAFFSIDGILIIYGEKGIPYPILCRKQLLESFLKAASLCVIEKDGEKCFFSNLKSTLSKDLKLVCTSDIFWIYNEKTKKGDCSSKNLTSAEEKTELIFKEGKEYKLYSFFSKNRFFTYVYGENKKPCIVFISKKKFRFF